MRPATGPRPSKRTRGTPHATASSAASAQASRSRRRRREDRGGDAPACEPDSAIHLSSLREVRGVLPAVLGVLREALLDDPVERRRRHRLHASRSAAGRADMIAVISDAWLAAENAFLPVAIS